MPKSQNSALTQGLKAQTENTQEGEPSLPTRELRMQLAAGDLAALTSLRVLVRAKLSAWAVTADQIDDILVVVSELATNALLHTCGPAYVRLENQSGRIDLLVTDTDSTVPDLGGTPESEAENGYGLACIAAAYADELTFVAHPEGKTAKAVFSVRR